MKDYTELKKLSKNNEVYLVRRQEDEKICVLRKINKKDESILDIYRLLKSNKISGIPYIYDIICDEEEMAIVEEYIEGISLLKYINEKGVLPDEEIVDISVAICDILSEIHNIDPPIVHKDIKAGNIMLSNDGNVFLIDFNAGRMVGDDDANKEMDTRLMGTPVYAAPEQFGFGVSTPATDYYGLGMLINSMALGEVTRKRIKGSPFTAIIAKCTRLEAKMRYVSAEMIKGELLNCINYNKYLNYEYEIENHSTKEKNTIINNTDAKSVFDIEKNFSVDGNEDIDINRDTLPIFEYRTDGEKSSGFNDNYEVVQKPGKKNRGIIRKIVSGIKREGRINSYATKTFAEEYICNNCGAILNEQVGFSPGNETWVCSNCNMVLNRDNPRGSIKYPGVHWYCDNCNTNLNIQEDFTDTEGKWTCTRCGHINTIDDDQILKKG